MMDDGNNNRGKISSGAVLAACRNRRPSHRHSVVVLEGQDGLDATNGGVIRVDLLRPCSMLLLHDR